jgi:hypothetical protein
VNCGGSVRALELVDHLAFGQLDLADLDREAEFGDLEFDRDLADADFADEGMGPPVAALGGIAERQEEALVAARQRLQAQRRGLAGSSSGSRVRSGGAFGVRRLGRPRSGPRG